MRPIIERYKHALARVGAAVLAQRKYVIEDRKLFEQAVLFAAGWERALFADRALEARFGNCLDRDMLNP